MNKVYKTKRNAQGNTVAASELAKSHSSTVTKALAALGMFAAAGTVAAAEIDSPQWVDLGGVNTLATASESTNLNPALEYAIGDNNTVDGAAALRWMKSDVDRGAIKADGTVVTVADIGTRRLEAGGVQAEGLLGGIAIGSNNTAQGGQAITIGFNNDTKAVSAEATVVIGSDIKFTGYSEDNLARKVQLAQEAGRTWTREDATLDNEGLTIIGSDHTLEVSKSITLIGHKGSITGTAQNAVGVGDQTNITSSNQGIAIGRATNVLNSHGGVSIGSTATVTGAYGGVALGVATKTNTANGVALGSFSEASRRAINATTVTTAGEGAQVAANEVYALSIANDQDKEDIKATVKGNYGVVSVGNDNATRQITNVAAGTADVDAVNVAQLQAVANVVEKQAGDITNLQGDVNQLNVAVAAAKTEVKAGENVVLNTTTGAAGQTVYTVNAEKDITNVAAGSNALTVNTTTNVDCCTTTRDVTVDLSDRSKDAIEKALTAVQSINVNVNGNQVSTVNQANPQVGFVEGKNITLGSDAAGNVTVATKDVVDFTTVNVGPVTVDAAKGIHAGDLQITGVKAGVAPTDAVNVSQLDQAKSDLTNYVNVEAAKAKTEVAAGENVSVVNTVGANGQTIATVSAKDTTYKSVSGTNYLTITEGATTKVDGVWVTEQRLDLSQAAKDAIEAAGTAVQDVVAGDNIQVTKNGNAFTVATTPDVAHNSVTLGGNVHISGTEVNMGGNQVSNVAAGTKGTDAVNVNQLNSAAAKATTEVVAGTHTTVTKAVAADGHAVYTVNGKDTVVASGSKSITVSNAFNPATNTTTSSVALSDRAEQGIELAHTAVQDVVAGDNIQVTKNGNSFTVATTPDVAHNSVTLGGKVVIAGDKVDVAGNQISNVAAGTKGTDAVNVDQLNTAAAKATTEVVAGTHTAVTKSTGTNGQAIYTVNGKDTVVTAGSESVAVSNVFDAATNTTTSTVGLTAKAEEGIKLGSTAVQTTQVAIDGKVVNVLNKDNNRQNFVAGKNVKLSTDSKGAVVIGTQDDVEFQEVVAKSFRSGDVHISANEVNAGGNKVTHVAAGEVSATSTDAVNGSQLHQTNQNVANIDNKVNNLFGDMQDRMDKYKKDLSAGIAGVNAAASLPQAHRAGQGSVAAAVGYYNNEAALAVGVSSISDSGRWTVKGQANINTRGDLGAGAGISYNF